MLYVAELNFEDISNEWDRLESHPESSYTDFDFWCEEIVGGTMDVSSITLKGCRENGLFVEIGRKLDLTNTNNRAMTIKELSDKFRCTPVEFINKITNVKQ